MLTPSFDEGMVSTTSMSSSIVRPDSSGTRRITITSEVSCFTLSAASCAAVRSESLFVEVTSCADAAAAADTRHTSDIIFFLI